jgi:hypothetical protein
MLSRAMSVPLVLAVACGALAAGASRWQQNEKLAVRKVEILTKDPACWKRVELRLDLAGAFQTPFDPNEIAVDAAIRTPSGRTMSVPAFFYQQHRIAPPAASGGPRGEALEPEGEPEWRLRFTPPEAGVYSVRIEARDRTGTAASAPMAIAVRPAPGQGYVRISKKDPRYFEFDDGTPYFAIGENLCWGPLADFQRWIPRLAKSGGNFARLWLGNARLNVESDTRSGEYRLDNAWRVDQIIELSEENGIYQKVSIEAIRNLAPEGEPRRTGGGFNPFSYAEANGGPCRSMRDFFELPQARRLFRNRLRYIVARWGYSTNIMAWELWNEFNTVNVPKPKEEIAIPWSREMCRYLKSIDATGRLTTNSLGSFDFWPDLWAAPEHEFTQMHGYYGWHRKNPGDEEPARAMTPLMIEWLDKLTAYRKPYLWAEFGIERQFLPEREYCEKDREGVHMHAGLWTPVMHGAAGCGHIWWWDSYVDPKDLYFHFRALADFVNGIPWTTAGFQPARVQADRQKLNALGLHGNALTILWIENKAHTWWNVVHDEPIPAMEGESIQVEGFPAGRYTVEYWDSWKGVPTAKKQVQSADNRLTIAVPRLERDIALKITPVR